MVIASSNRMRVATSTTHDDTSAEKAHEDHTRLNRLLALSVCAATVLAASSRSFLALDGNLTGWVRANQTAPFARIALAITALGSTPFALGLVAIGALFFLIKRRWTDAMLLTLAVGGVSQLVAPLKQFFDRPRPVFLGQTLTFAGSGFPSGHAMTITAICGAMSIILIRRETDLARRRLVRWAAASLIAIVASTRIYLGAHYLTDVVGGVAFGLVWLIICDAAVDRLAPHFQTVSGTTDRARAVRYSPPPPPLPPPAGAV